MSSDPIGEGGGVNRYCFVENNPTTKADALGLLASQTACCCDAKKVMVKWSAVPPAIIAGGFVFTLNISWEGEKLDSCEARQFVTITVTIPGLDKAGVIAAYSKANHIWPWNPQPTEAPFVTDQPDWGWRALPFDDPHNVWAGTKRENNSSINLPTAINVAATIKVRDKDTQEVKATKTYSYHYRNYDPTKQPFTPTDADATIFDTVGIDK